MGGATGVLKEMPANGFDEAPSGAVAVVAGALTASPTFGLSLTILFNTVQWGRRKK